MCTIGLCKYQAIRRQQILFPPLNQCIRQQLCSHSPPPYILLPPSEKGLPLVDFLSHLYVQYIPQHAHLLTI